MLDKEKLNKGRQLFEQGAYVEARKVFESILTKDLSIRLNVLLAMLGVLDHVSENDKLLAVVNEGIEITTRTNNEGVRSFLLGKKCLFLMSEHSSIIYRQINLTLSSRVFGWLGFSLERDKQEYDSIGQQCKNLEQEIESILYTVIERAERETNQGLRGHQFSSIGDAYSSKFLSDKLALQKGGKIKSRIANNHFVRRWNLDRYLYSRVARKKIDDSHDRCIHYFERSIEDFQLAGMKSEQAHAMYNLATKMLLFNGFRRTKKLLIESRALAISIGEKRLLDKIEYLEKRVLGENEMRDYVSEMGLDMPDGHHPSI
ncbi:hypothetical protein BH11PAT2_BH11PAT2_04850 [soil metagenome]